MRVFNRCRCPLPEITSKKIWYCFKHKQWWRLKIKIFRGAVWVRCSKRRAVSVEFDEAHSHRLIK